MWCSINLLNVYLLLCSVTYGNPMLFVLPQFRSTILSMMCTDSLKSWDLQLLLQSKRQTLQHISDLIDGAAVSSNLFLTKMHQCFWAIFFRSTPFYRFTPTDWFFAWLFATDILLLKLYRLQELICFLYLMGIGLTILDAFLTMVKIHRKPFSGVGLGST